jgi:hypothetical protein
VRAREVEHQEVKMAADDADAIELQLQSPAAAIQFLKNNIENEAKNIEVVKNATGNGYVGTASGFPTE